MRAFKMLHCDMVWSKNCSCMNYEVVQLNSRILGKFSRNAFNSRMGSAGQVLEGHLLVGVAWSGVSENVID